MTYYFGRGSTKAEMIIWFLYAVFDTCQKDGQEVVTICVVGANYDKVLKLFIPSKRNNSLNISVKKF